MKLEYFPPALIQSWIFAANTGDGVSIEEVEKRWNPEEVELYQLVMLNEILGALGGGTVTTNIDYEAQMAIMYNDGGVGDELRVAYAWENSVLQPPVYFEADGVTPYAGVVNNPATQAVSTPVKAVFRIEGTLTGLAIPAIAPYSAEVNTAGRAALLVPVGGKNALINFPHYGIDIKILPSTSTHDAGANDAYFVRNGFQYNAGFGDSSYKTEGRSDFYNSLTDQSEDIEAFGDLSLEITVITTKKILNTYYP